MMLSSMMNKKGGVPKPESDEFDTEDVNRGLQEEAKEHPWMDPKMLRKLVTDHLKMDEDYYETEEEPETDAKESD